jgi:hypothetical protein
MCSHCEFESLAKVRAKGEGEATSYLWLREEGAKSDAQREAVRKAEEAAERMAAAGTCPACQQHDGSARSSLQSGAWLAGVGLGVVMAVIVLVVFGKLGFGMPIALVAGIGTTLWHVATRSWMWEPSRVEVLGHPELAALLVKHGVEVGDPSEALEEAVG